MRLHLTSLAETEAFGRWLGERLPAGAFVALVGDLGAGKTALARSVLAGLGIERPGGSPTFTIMVEYTGGRRPVYHFDVYRLEGLEELEDLGYEEYFYGDGVALVEWADRVRDLWPADFLEVALSAPDPLAAERVVALTAVGPWAQALVKELSDAGTWS